eukprot:5151_1
MAELPSTPRRFNRSQQVHGRAQSAPPIHKKRMKVTNKASYTKCEISDALDYYDDNITEKALSFIVVELKKKKMFHSLKINTMKTWVRRYPKGSEARRKLREQGESKRTKSKLYPELEQALWNEIDRREKESLLRDVDTMQMWCVQLVEKWIKEGKHHYDNCKVSRGWMYDTIEELCLAKKQHTFKKENLGSMRIWFMNEIKKAKDEINKNHTQLIKNSWNNSLLVAKCDGSEDEVYLAAPQKKLSKRQFAAKMFLYETDSESDEVESESESEGKKK